MLAGLDLLAGARFTELPGEWQRPRGETVWVSNGQKAHVQFYRAKVKRTMYVAEYHDTQVQQHSYMFMYGEEL